MSLATKNRIHFLAAYFLAAFLLLSGVSVAFAQGVPAPAPAATVPASTAPPPAVVTPPPQPNPAPAAAASVPPSAIPVKIGSHGDYTRVVFDFPKLLAYHVKDKDGHVEMTFETKAAAAITGAKSSLIKNIIATPESDGMLKVDINLAGGSTIKHYRLKRKIILDVYASGAVPKPEPAAQSKVAQKASDDKTAPVPLVAAAPALTEAAPQPAKPVLTETPSALSDLSELAAAKLPADAPPEKPAPELAVTKPQGFQPDGPKTMPAIPTPPVTQESVDMGGATINLSSFSPMKLAVFERANALWIVTDASGGASLPSVSGPMAMFIAKPKVLKFEGATAYRYVLPRKLYPRVTKGNLSWEVSLTPEPPSAPEGLSSAKITVQFDPASRKAKLMAPLQGAGDALSFEDPEIGDTLYVVPTGRADQVVRESRRLADLEVLPAATGMVVRPLRDGIGVHPVNDFVLLTAPSGLAVTPEGMGAAVLIGEADDNPADDHDRLFDFPNWQQGGIKKLQENKQKLQEEIVAAPMPEDRTGALMKLATLYFANNFGQEALGVLSLVQSENPDIEKNPNFIAIRGAANAMSGHYKEALQDLSFPAIQQHPEVNLWIGFAAAATEQWHMADRSFPKNNRMLLQYPDNIAIPFTIYMAESALRLGRADTAKQLLDSIDMTSGTLDSQYQAAIDYLRGEAFSQGGQPDQAIALWQPVAKGLDRLYHTKASLSLARLLLQQKKITLKEAIDRVDSLRFAWRGDGLEVEILHTLGALKVQDNLILSGLQDMKQAAKLAESALNDPTRIKDDMRRVFYDLFVTDQSEKISPLEAVSIYDEFNSLMPDGAEGTAAVLNFADYLIRMDLLSRAAELIEAQIGNLPDEKVPAVGTKLAAVYLLDARPDRALDALKGTERTALTDKLREERSLLKARAQSQMNQTDAAISTLSALNSRNAQRLKADVLWRAQKWSAAAQAIDVLLPEQGKLISDDDAALVVNAAVAWKLAGNTDKLKEIRSKYDAAMAGKKLEATFGVVTRDGGASSLADRDSVLKIAGEVDMFRGFLDNYKAGTGGS